MSFVKFIAPPCGSCIKPSCLYKQLTVHNNPVNALVFTFSGPVSTTKISLRCQKCLTVYNYSMFGRKQREEGEHFYHEERPLIEISDTVFIERNLYNMFSVLRQVYR